MQVLAVFVLAYDTDSPGSCLAPSHISNIRRSIVGGN